jgi:hypothetical protein
MFLFYAVFDTTLTERDYESFTASMHMSYMSNSDEVKI